MAEMIPGPKPLPLEEFAPLPFPSPPPSTEPSPPPPVGPFEGFPLAEWGSWVTSVLTPEIVVKTTLPWPFGPTGRSPGLRFCELGPERCTEPSWGNPEWERGGPPGGDGMEGSGGLEGSGGSEGSDMLEESDGLESGEPGLGVGVDGLGGVLRFGFGTLALPLPGFKGVGV